MQADRYILKQQQDSFLTANLPICKSGHQNFLIPEIPKMCQSILVILLKCNPIIVNPVVKCDPIQRHIPIKLLLGSAPGDTSSLKPSLH